MFGLGQIEDSGSYQKGYNKAIKEILKRVKSERETNSEYIVVTELIQWLTDKVLESVIEEED